VIASECTGCELCIVPCPVDCISMTEVNQGIASWRWPRSQDASRISL
jgi:electron transport complex protein RnfB